MATTTAGPTTEPPPAGWYEYLSSRPSPWKRSAKGNLYRRWGALTLTVFARGSGRYGYCISFRGSAAPRFSPTSFATEEEAVDAVRIELEGA